MIKDPNQIILPKKSFINLSQMGAIAELKKIAEVSALRFELTTEKKISQLFLEFSNELKIL
jgi:hypothetical protein